MAGLGELPSILIAVIFGKLRLCVDMDFCIQPTEDRDCYSYSRGIHLQLQAVRAVCKSFAAVPLERFLPTILEGYPTETLRRYVRDNYCGRANSRWPRWPLRLLPMLARAAGGLNWVSGRGENARSPLGAAVSNNNLAAVRELIALGADVNEAEPGTLRSPLWFLAESGRRFHEEEFGGTPQDGGAIVEALVAAGARVDDADRFGDTPLNIACFHKREDVALALIAAGADVNARDGDGKGPLYYAFEKECSLALRGALIDKGADVDVGSGAGDY